MRIIAYRASKNPFCLRPASPRREWMDRTSLKFAYRCLPLTIANQHGWELLNPFAFEALWNGGAVPRSVAVRALEPVEDEARDFVTCHFGHGVLTWRPGYLFQTDSPYDLYVTGPPNCAKDGIVALTGLVETEWLPFPFTMNWMFTRPGVPIRFEKDEPICHLFPVDRDAIERVEPEIRDLESRPELCEQFNEWRSGRTAFIEEMHAEGTDARAQGWQRFYTEGRYPGGSRGPARHRTRLHVKPFANVSTGQP